MAEYTRITTLIERVGALGYAPHHAARHIRYGRVRVDGRVVTDPFAPVGDESDVEVRMVVGAPRNTTRDSATSV